MAESLDVSLHGTQRVEIIERLVHICRYSPGLVLLDGEPGVSPVKFLRHMADLLRDELDFALINSSLSGVELICDSLISQWHVYCSDDNDQTNIQRIHHFLDVGKDAGRMVLVVVERAAALEEDAANFLIDLLARHSRLTVFFSGIVDSRALLRRTWQAEVPVHRIELPEGLPLSRSYSQSTEQGLPPIDSQSRTAGDVFLGKSIQNTQLSRSGYGQADFINEKEYCLSDNELDSGLAASRLDGVDERRGIPRVQKRPADFARTLEPALGVSMRLSDLRTWGTRTFAGFHRERSRLSMLMVSIGALAVLLLLVTLYYPDKAEQPLGAVGSSVIKQSPASGSIPVVSDAGPDVIGSSNPVNAAGKIVDSVPPVVGIAVPAAVNVSSSQPLSAGGIYQDKVLVESKTAPPTIVMPVKAAKSSPDSAKNPAAKDKPHSKKSMAASQKIWYDHPERFTVQLAATRNESAVNALALRLPKDNPHFVYRAKKDGKPWFVLVYGSFSSHEQAIRSRERLSASLKKDVSPWVRKQGEIFGR
ncbi:MAG TPA: SPOR domain-containing protein [Pseudomonadales bacterium]|nr:SPOR domain-containing protein [Pseudomonadales bacterium]